jgi:hypothetical protein
VKQLNIFMHARLKLEKFLVRCVRGPGGVADRLPDLDLTYGSEFLHANLFGPI